MKYDNMFRVANRTTVTQVRKILVFIYLIAKVKVLKDVQKREGM